MVIYYWHLSIEVGGEETESSMFLSPPPPLPPKVKRNQRHRDRIITGPKDYYFQSSRGPHYAAQADRFLQVPMEPSDVCLSLFKWLHEWPKQTRMMIDRMALPGAPSFSVTQDPGIRVRGQKKTEACVSIRKPSIYLSRLLLATCRIFLDQALIAIFFYSQS